MRQTPCLYAQVRHVPHLLPGTGRNGRGSWGKKVELVRQMTVTDPIADMLTRMRNAIMVGHDGVLIPSSQMKLSIAKILKEEGFIDRYEVLKATPESMIKVHLKYTDNQPAILGLERVSKPGLRVYVERRRIPRVYGGLGVSILSTSKGIMTGQEAWRQHLGGEILCYVW